MNLRLLSSLRSGLNGRLNPNRISQMLLPKDLEELGLDQREQAVLSARGPGKRTAELYGLTKAPKRRRSPRPAYSAAAMPAGALRLSPAAISPAARP